MSKHLQSAFSKIQAETDLKVKTKAFLNREMLKKSKCRHKLTKRVTLAFASFIFLFITSLSVYVYLTPSAYIDIDINPGIELTVNGFNRVLKVNPYNDDGTNILALVDVTNMEYSEAMRVLVEKIISEGYLAQDGLVSVTVQTGDGPKGEKFVTVTKNTVSYILDTYNINAESEVFPISRSVKDEAGNNCVSPAKYLAILELMEVDEDATIEGCMHESIGAIRQRAKTHDECQNERGNHDKCCGKQNRKGHK